MDVYLIREFNMIGATFHTHEKYTFNEYEVIVEGNKIKRAGVLDNNNRYYTLSLTPKGVDYLTTALLPYYAVVTEDMPSQYKFKPKVYSNCQLTTEKPGGYYIFKCLDSGKLLKIAINSHVYTRKIV